MKKKVAKWDNYWRIVLTGEEMKFFIAILWRPGHNNFQHLKAQLLKMLKTRYEESITLII